MKANAERLRQALSDSHVLAAELDQTDFPLPQLETMQAWQRSRLAVTYEDLISQNATGRPVIFSSTSCTAGCIFASVTRKWNASCR